MTSTAAPTDLARLEASFETLRRVVAFVAPEALDHRWTDGKWTPHEQVAHLVRYQTVFLTRLRRILHEDAPSLPRYQSEDDPEFPALVAMMLPDLIALGERTRAELHDLVSTLDTHARARSGRHPLFGLMPIPQWLDLFLVHEGHHAYAILLRSRPT